MPVSLVRACPHCGTDNCAFNYLAHVCVSDHAASAAFTCNRCHKVLGVYLLANISGMDFTWLKSASGDFDEHMKQRAHWRVNIYPKPKVYEAPEHVPDAAKRAFLQAESNAAAGNFDAAAAMYRKSIDVGTRALDAGLANKLMFQRIEALSAKGALTPELTEWAHAVRLDGNQGAHDDDELTKEEMDQLASFARLFLVYTFTMPAQVAARKADR